MARSKEVPEPLLRLLGDLGSPVRVRLLDALAGAPASVTDLTGEVALSPQEVSRHLARLDGLGLVARDEARAYRLTPFARAVREELPAFQRLLACRGFFESHALARLPPALPMRPLALAEHVAASEPDNRRAALEALERGRGRARFAAPELGWAASGLRGCVARDRAVELLLPWTEAAGDALLGFGRGLDAAAARRVTVLLAEEVPLVLALGDEAALAFFPRPRGGIDFSDKVCGDAGFRGWCEGAFEALRSGAVLAFDPQRDAAAAWRSALTSAASRFIAPRRASPLAARPPEP